MTIETDLISKFWIPVFLILISIPFILEKIPPNHVFGLRTKKALSNDMNWYQVNKYAGWLFLIAGTLMFIYRLF